MWSEPPDYGRLSWPEVRRAVDEGRVPIVPIGTLEDHGPHLPIDTDVTLVTDICRGAAEKVADRSVLLPPIVHGYSPHHMDFAGTVTISWDTFCRYCTDVAISLVRHGFKRVLLVNGHGSNQNLVDMAARLAGVEHPDSLVASSFYLTSPRGLAAVEKQRDSKRGGIAHACELETSLYLYLHPEAVEMDKAVDEVSYPSSESIWMDWVDGPLKLMPWWSSFSRSGIQGRPTLASAEKGKALFEAATSEIAAYVDELMSLPLPERQGPRDDFREGAT